MWEAKDVTGGLLVSTQAPLGAQDAPRKAWGPAVSLPSECLAPQLHASLVAPGISISVPAAGRVIRAHTHPPPLTHPPNGVSTNRDLLSKAIPGREAFT